LPSVEREVERLKLSLPFSMVAPYRRTDGKRRYHSEEMERIETWVQQIPIEDVTEVARMSHGAVSTWKDPDGWQVASVALVASGHGGDAASTRPSVTGRFVELVEAEAARISGGGMQLERKDVLAASIWRPRQDAFQHSPDIRRVVAAEFAAARIVDVDGSLRVRCPEPYLTVRIDHDEKLGIFVSHSWRLLASPGVDAPFLFRLDGKDAAEEFAFDFLRTTIRAPRMNILRPDLLEFEPAEWNLRAGLARTIRRLDNRACFLALEVQSSVLAAARHLETWEYDVAVAAASTGADDFLDHAGRILDELDKPVFEDIGEPAVMKLAFQSFDRLDAMRGMSAEDDDEALAEFRI
jgi:hypothetical protein